MYIALTLVVVLSRLLTGGGRKRREFAADDERERENKKYTEAYVCTHRLTLGTKLEFSEARAVQFF